MDPPGIVVTPSTNQTVAVNSNTTIKYHCKVHGAGRAALWSIAGVLVSNGSSDQNILATKGIVNTNGSSDSEVFLSIDQSGKEFIDARGSDLTVACFSYMAKESVRGTTGCKYYVRIFGRFCMCVHV